MLPDPARLAAFEVISAVTGRAAYANLMLASALRQRRLTGQDAALATELVYGTLRGRARYDAIIGVCADRDIGQIDPAVLDVLRLGAHQLLSMRIKAHAAVSTSVDLAVAVAGRRPAGFVNAVLRKVAQRGVAEWLEIVAPARDADLEGHLAVRHSHPRWIVAALAEALGEDPRTGGLERTEAALAADDERPLVTLAAVPGLATVRDLVAEGAAAARWSPFGGYLDHGDPAGLRVVAERRAGVQDEASQLAALALSRAEVTTDRPWLDLCAGPGGKSRLLAGLAADAGARLLAADVHQHRARLAAAAVSLAGPRARAGRGARAGRDGGECGSDPAGERARAITADGLRPAWRPASFGRVLADVPCTGLGSLRRRPETRWRRCPDDVAALHPLQTGLLESALDAAMPGGVVAYVTCSPHLSETRQVVADVLAGRTDAEVLDAPGLLPEVPGLACPEPYQRYAQFWPHRHGTDAIFIAMLRRTGTSG